MNVTLAADHLHFFDTATGRRLPDLAPMSQAQPVRTGA